MPKVSVSKRGVAWFVAGSVLTGTNISAYVLSPFGGSIVEVGGYSRIAPTGTSIVANLRINGVTVMSGAARLTIAAGATSGATSTILNASIKRGDGVTLDIDQIGSTIAGEDFTATMFINVTE